MNNTLIQKKTDGVNGSPGSQLVYDACLNRFSHPLLLIYLASELLPILGLHNAITCLLVPPIRIPRLNPTAAHGLRVTA